MLTEDGDKWFLFLTTFNMREIGTLKKLNMVQDKNYIKHVWPLLAMWALENLYLECRPGAKLLHDKVEETDFKTALARMINLVLDFFSLTNEDLDKVFYDGHEKQLLVDRESDQ